VRVQSRLLQPCGALRSRQRTLVSGLQGLQLSGRGVHFFGAQVSPLLIRVFTHLYGTDWVRFTGYSGGTGLRSRPEAQCTEILFIHTGICPFLMFQNVFVETFNPSMECTSAVIMSYAECYPSNKYRFLVI